MQQVLLWWLETSFSAIRTHTAITMSYAGCHLKRQRSSIGAATVSTRAVLSLEVSIQVYLRSPVLVMQTCLKRTLLLKFGLHGSIRTYCQISSSLQFRRMRAAQQTVQSHVSTPSNAVDLFAPRTDDLPLGIQRILLIVCSSVLRYVAGAQEAAAQWCPARFLHQLIRCTVELSSYGIAAVTLAAADTGQ